MSSLFSSIFYGRELPKESDVSSSIQAVDNFEIAILEETNEELISAEKKLEKAKSSLEELSQNKIDIGGKITKAKENIRNFESKLKTPITGKKGRAKRSILQMQLQGQKELLSSLEKQLTQITEKSENVINQISTLDKEKISIEKTLV